MWKLICSRNNNNEDVNYYFFVYYMVIEFNYCCFIDGIYISI